MAIGLICRHCGARLKVAESAAGKLGKCPKCKKKIRVPKIASPDAHFCDRCEKSLADEEGLSLVEGKAYCSDCLRRMQAKKKTGDPVLDQLGIDIPGAVVLRGKDQRKIGRMLQDVAAKKDYKVKTSHVAGPEAPAEVEEKPPPEEPQPPEPPVPAKLAKGQRPADAKLIQLLVAQGVVLRGELELALQYQKGLGKRLIPVLDDLKLTSEEEVARTISQNTGLEICPEGELEIAPGVQDLMDDELMSHYEVIPLRRDGDTLVVALPNPLDVTSIKEMRDALNSRIIPRVCTWLQYTGARRLLRTRSKS